MKDWTHELTNFAAVLELAQKTALVEKGYRPELHDHAVTVKTGKKFARVDVGTSGKYMVDLETGEIFGIKAYGVVHRGHKYGSLATLHEWDWRGYTAVLVVHTFTAAPIN